MKRKQPSKSNEDPEYATVEFWNRRHEDKNEHEWYFSYEHLKPLISQCTTDTKQEFQCLEIGCGFAPLIQGMAADITGQYFGIDFSPSIVKSLVEKNNVSNITYDTMDARDLRYDDDSMDLVIDKGTIDAMLCAEEWADNVDSIMNNMCRVLRPGGSILLISHMEYESSEFQSILSDILLPILTAKGTSVCKWSVEVHCSKNNATVYKMDSVPRRVTRSLSTGSSIPPVIQVSVMDYDSDEEEEDDSS